MDSYTYRGSRGRGRRDHAGLRNVREVPGHHAVRPSTEHNRVHERDILRPEWQYRSQVGLHIIEKNVSRLS